MMKTLAAALMILVTPILSAQDAPKEFVVHEWGTFTTVAGADGTAVDWRPLVASDLPNFVYTLAGTASGKGLRGADGDECLDCGHDDCGCGDRCDPNEQGQCGCCKGCIKAKMRMETPVIYFYAGREMDVRVKVNFPKGLLTEWYPSVAEVAPFVSRKRGVRSHEGGMLDWGTIKITPRGPQNLIGGGAGHYFCARDVDADFVRVCTARSEAKKAEPEWERFLFYRGVGDFTMPISATSSGDRITAVTSGVDLKHVFILSFNGERGSFGDSQAGGAGFEGDRKTVTEKAIAALKAALISEGLFEKEAQAMIATWRDSYFEDGARVLYIVPRKIVDEFLPLEIAPAPAKLERVFVGRVECITPAREKNILDLVAKLDVDDPHVRDVAHRAIEREGRFAEPTLKKALAEARDPEVLARIELILKSIR